jgi:hypothetical protein
MKNTYERLSQESKILNQNLNIIKEQLTSCLPKFTESKSGLDSDNKNKKVPCDQQIQQLVEQIRRYEIEIRQNLNDANELVQKNFPNSHLLKHNLERLNDFTIQLIASLPKEISSKFVDNLNTQYQSSTFASSPITPSTLNVANYTSSSGISSASSRISSSHYDSITIATPDSHLKNSINVNTSPISNSFSTASSYSSSNQSTTSSTTPTNGHPRTIVKPAPNTQIHTHLTDLINESVKWIKEKQKKLYSIEYKSDISLIEYELSQLRMINSETRQFHGTMEQIELLKFNHANSEELNLKLNELFMLFNEYCVSCLSNRFILNRLFKNI